MCTMHWRYFLTLLSCLLLFAACAHAELPSPTAPPPPQSTAVLSTPFPPIALEIPPAEIAERLTPTDALAPAVEQLATLLAIPPSQIGIRIRSKDCTICNLDENGTQSQPSELTLTEAEALISAYDLLWLVAQPLSCSYYYDGKRMTPRGCQLDIE